MSDETTTEDLAETILRIAAQQKPETVSQLAELVRQAYHAQDKETLDVRQAYEIQSKQILNTILKLQEQRKLQLTPHPEILAASAYLKTSAALWFWITIILALATPFAVLIIPETAYPLVYIRYVLGIIFILWLPGYAFTRALFPEQLQKTLDKNLDIIIRTALTIGTSLSFVPMVGLLLYYTPFGVNLKPILLSLVALTMIFAIAAVLRENQVSTSKET